MPKKATKSKTKAPKKSKAKKVAPKKSKAKKVAKKKGEKIVKASAKLKKVLKDYEMMVVLKPLLPDDVRKAIHKDFLGVVKEDGGEVIDVDVWGKRYLAYDIKGHNEGYYLVYNFKISTQKLIELRRQLEMKQEILRYLILEVIDPSLIGTRIKKKEMSLDI